MRAEARTEVEGSAALIVRPKTADQPQAGAEGLQEANTDLPVKLPVLRGTQRSQAGRNRWTRPTNQQTNQPTNQPTNGAIQQSIESHAHN